MPDTLYFLMTDGTTYVLEVDAGRGETHRDSFIAGQNPYNQAFAALGPGTHIRTAAVVALELVLEGETRPDVRER